MKTINGYEIGPGADMRRADLSGTDLRGANLHGADLSGARLHGTDLSYANLHGADLSGAKLHGADLSGAKLHGTDLSGADLSGAIGLLDPWKWLLDNFEQGFGGFIVYKRIGETKFQAPGSWTIEPGEYLREVVNPDRGTDCGCGVNFGTLKWCQMNYRDTVLWRCLLPWEGVASLVVPYNTDGKARTGCLKLIEIVEDR